MTTKLINDKGDVNEFIRYLFKFRAFIREYSIWSLPDLYFL